MENEGTISPELLNFMQMHKIPDVQTLLLVEDEVLLKMDGFGWRMMYEVLNLRKI